MAGAKRIMDSLDRIQLAQYGGNITFTTSWVKSLLKWMNFTRHKATMKCALPPHVFKDGKEDFLRSVIEGGGGGEGGKMKEIPSQLIFNWN